MTIFELNRLAIALYLFAGILNSTRYGELYLCPFNSLNMFLNKFSVYVFFHFNRKIFSVHKFYAITIRSFS